MSWKRLNRKTLVDTKFLKVFEDTVELPNGKVFDDYSVVQKNDFAMIVALDEKGDLIAVKEYKYAVDQVLNGLPAGVLDKDEVPLETAKRELLEETGYTSDSWEELGGFYEYATKDSHTAYLFKATNARKTGETKFDATEDIELFTISIEKLKEEIAQGKWKSSVNLTAFVMAGIYK